MSSKNEYDIFSPEYIKAREEAALKAIAFGHRKVGSVHIFLGAFALMAQNIVRSPNKEFSDMYKEDYLFLKEAMNGAGLNSEIIVRVFTEIYKPEIDPGSGTEVGASEEFSRIESMLQKQAMINERSVDLKDLFLELFSDRSYTIRAVIKQAITDNVRKADPNPKTIDARVTETIEKLYDSVLTRFKPAIIGEIKDLESIPEYLTNLNKKVAHEKPTFINIDKTLSQIIMGLDLMSTPNVIVVGPSGVGKTCAIKALAQRINEGKVPDFLKKKVIYSLNAGALISGKKYRGEFESALTRVLEAAKDNPNAIIFIDEAHMMMKLGDTQDGGTGAAQIMKPYLEFGGVQMIWATTNDEYGKYIESDSALSSRFTTIRIPEPSIEETSEILKGLLKQYDDHYGKKASPELVDSVAKMSVKSNLSYSNPRKSIKMLEMAYAHGHIFNEKNELIMSDDLRDAIKLQYGITFSDKKAADCKAELKKVLLGQDKAIDQVCDNIEFIEKGLCDKEKPLLSILELGPTGVGKTEAARIIADKFCGSKNYLIKIDMGEFGSEMDVSKLLGSSPGYVGSDQQSELVTKVKQYPNSVVLFDEVEKANPKVFDPLLNMLDTGILTDNQGNQVSFRNCIIIFTSNIGYTMDFAKEKGIGFVKSKTESSDIKEAAMKFFRPEFINRLDDIVVFDGLDKDIAKTLIERYRLEYEAQSGMKIAFSKADIDEIIRNSKIETFGARGLRRSVKTQIVKVLSKVAA